MEQTIGELAGRVYQFLDENGEASVSEIAKSVHGSRSKVNMAIGWLAREDNLSFSKKGNGNKVSLK